MQITATFLEIQRFILREYRKEIGMKYVDSQTLSLSFSPSRLIPSVRIDVKIEEIIGNMIIISYNGNRGINLIIRGLLSYLDKKINKGIVTILPGKRLIYAKLDSIEAIQKVLGYLEPKDIRFVEKGVIVRIRVKD